MGLSERSFENSLPMNGESLHGSPEEGWEEDRSSIEGESANREEGGQSRQERYALVLKRIKELEAWMRTPGATDSELVEEGAYAQAP